MKKVFFITGTDTNIGKTTVSCEILKIAKKNGYKSCGYKPISTGGILINGKLVNKDAFLLKKYSAIKLNYKDINPIVFLQKTSPNIASKLSNKKIKFKTITNKLNKLKKISNFIVIEGIGGWYTPISNRNTLADWVLLKNLHVILVVGLKLGCINHSILTAEAILNKKINLIGWIANEIIPKYKYKKDYILTLKNNIPSPMIGIIPFLKGKNFKIYKQQINFEKLVS